MQNDAYHLAKLLERTLLLSLKHTGKVDIEEARIFLIQSGFD